MRTFRKWWVPVDSELKPLLPCPWRPLWSSPLSLAAAVTQSVLLTLLLGTWGEGTSLTTRGQVGPYHLLWPMKREREKHVSLAGEGIIPTVRFSRAPFPGPRTLHVADGAAVHQGPCTRMTWHSLLEWGKMNHWCLNQHTFHKQLDGKYFQLRGRDDFCLLHSALCSVRAALGGGKRMGVAVVQFALIYKHRQGAGSDPGPQLVYFSFCFYSKTL